MAQKDLDLTDIESGLQQMGGEAVPKGVKPFTGVYEQKVVLSGVGSRSSAVARGQASEPPAKESAPE